MTLHLTVPADRLVALRWVADVVFNRMLAIPVAVKGQEGTSDIRLQYDGKVLATPSLFPRVAADAIDLSAPLPSLPLTVLDLEQAGFAEAGTEALLPILFGSPAIEMGYQQVDCGLDLLGGIFLMLSRYEEVVLPERDRHDRFPGSASLAHKAGFLYRPIVDEYVELLWAMMSRLWPGLQRKRRQGKVTVSCDVDQPFDRVGKNARLLARSLAGDLAKRGDPGLAYRRLRNFFVHRRGDFRFDPYYTFDWYMDVCERHGRQAAFYFIPDHSAGAIDGTYHIQEERILQLMRKMAGRGHCIGMHGSYNTYRDGAQIQKERDALEQALCAAGLQGGIQGNRQHYLRWSVVETADHLDVAGFDYDTSGSFADRPGFRYGTAHPFPMWSWKNFAPMNVEQRPLVVMECSVIEPTYLGMGYTDAALELMSFLKEKAMWAGGDFTLLWHNSFFLKRRDREFFEYLLR